MKESENFHLTERLDIGIAAETDAGISPNQPLTPRQAANLASALDAAT